MVEKKVSIFHPKNRFGELTRIPGGVPRDAAVAAASSAVDSLRGESIAGVLKSIGAIEEVLAAGAGERVDAKDLGKILLYAEGIVTLSETFGLTLLAFIGKSLCDLVQWFTELPPGRREPLIVHARSLHFAAPPRTMTAAEADRILGELSRTLTFFGCVPREEMRVKSLEKIEILDHETDAAFEHILEFAQREFQVPVAAITLVEAERQWFSSDIELDMQEASRNVSVCTDAAQGHELLVIEDALLDPRFNCDGTAALSLRFFACAPVRKPKGPYFGSICVIDRGPRTFSDESRRQLRALANNMCKAVEARAIRLLSAA